MNKTIVEKVNRLKKGEKIPLMYDECMHIMFGNPEKMEPLTLLVSRILEVKYEDIEGRIELLPRDVPKDLIHKKTERDIVVRILDDYKKMVLEVNVRNSHFDSIINRNLLYLGEIFGSNIKEGDSYDELETTLLINFNTFYVDNSHKKLFDYYCFRNEEGYILTEKQKILNINIDKCYRLLYNESVPEFKNSYEKDLFYLCASMVTKSEKEFSECIDEIEIKDKIKRIIEEVSTDMNDNNELKARYYDFLEEERKMNESIMHEVTRKAKEEGINETKQEMVINMFNKNIDLDIISECSGLTKEEIEKVIKEKKI